MLIENKQTYKYLISDRAYFIYINDVTYEDGLIKIDGEIVAVLNCNNSTKLKMTIHRTLDIEFENENKLIEIPYEEYDMMYNIYSHINIGKTYILK